MLKRIKISGNSLNPDFQEGDFVVTVKIPLLIFFIRPGDVVVFIRQPYGTMIKRVEWVDRTNQLVFVVGSHSNSIDSHQYGPIPSQDLIGKVIWHIPYSSRHENQST